MKTEAEIRRHIKLMSMMDSVATGPEAMATKATIVALQWVLGEHDSIDDLLDRMAAEPELADEFRE